MDGPRDRHTSEVKSEESEVRERQISYDTSYMQNLKKYIQMNLFINGNRVTDIENIYKEERWGGAINWEFEIDRYTSVYLKLKMYVSQGL